MILDRNMTGTFIEELRRDLVERFGANEPHVDSLIESHSQSIVMAIVKGNISPYELAASIAATDIHKPTQKEGLH